MTRWWSMPMARIKKKVVFGESHSPTRTYSSFTVSAFFRGTSPLRLATVAMAMPLFHPISLLNRNRSVFGVNLGHLWHKPDKIRA
jgi:hypothetical protein